MRALICDDEPRLADALRDELTALWPELQIVGLAHNGGEALAMVDELAPDILFLDIRMPGLSGLDVARQLAGSPGAPRIVFVTAYEDHAIEAFESRAVDYLLKPVRTERLRETVARLQARQPAASQDAPQVDARLIAALQQLRAPEKKHLRWLNCGLGAEIDVIATSEVLLFQSRDKYTAVITAQRERYIRMPLKDLVNELDPDEFWQVHRSAVIRASAIERVTRDESGKLLVRLAGVKETVSVSATFSGRFKQM
ncbi:MAG: LytTR family DNA-binding domain-containing protein [Burkholderiales bacterium]|nr:LytTR family DNA-binding domain-containing protein [Burkholderiales bacterium]